MEKKVQIWILGDEQSIFLELAEIIRSHFSNFEVQSIESPRKLYDCLDKDMPDILFVDVHHINSDSTSLLQEIRKFDNFSNIFIILIGNKENYKVLLDGLDSGANDIILLPLIIEKVLARIKSALHSVELINNRKEMYSIVQELAEQLEKTESEEIDLILKIYSIRLSISKETINLIEGASLWIINFLKYTTDEDSKDIEISSDLSFLGRIILPDRLFELPVYSEGNVSDPLMYQIPIVARNIISGIPRLEKVGDILYHIYENMDGTGFPDKLQSWQIPLESRILRVALDYCDIMRYHNIKSSDALLILKKYTNQLYDQRVVILFEQYILSILKLEGEIDEISISIQNMEPGMQLSRDIYTNNGLKLLNVGNYLTEAIITKIISHNTTDPILGFIYIKK
jgi:response regulator RpfG family c-di-GMP phosphodiesterase